MSVPYKKSQDFEDTKIIPIKSTPKEVSLQFPVKEMPIYSPHKENFNIVPTVMSVNSGQNGLLIGGSNMLKLYKITEAMRLTLLEKNLSHRFHSLSRSTIKDVSWNPRNVE